MTIASWITALAPAPGTPEQRAQGFKRVAWTTMLVSSVFLALQILEDPSTLRRRGVSMLVVNALGLGALGCNARGRTALASWLFLIGLIGTVTWRAWTIGGVDAPIAAAYVVMVVMGGVLLGGRGGAAIAAFCAALMLGLIGAAELRLLPPRQMIFTPLGLWLSNCIWVALALGLQGQIAASLRGALETAQRELGQRRQAEAQLRERVKELRLLHAAATLLQRSRSSGLEVFRELVTLIPAAWQYPERCAARITFGDTVAATPGWRETEWRQAKQFVTEEGAGTIEVVYLEPCPPADEGPFLAEERAVLESLAEMLMAYVELRRQRHGLEQLVATRTRELSIARDQADRASRAKSVFLANMSHEIRTPLNAVLGHAQLLGRDVSATDAQRRSAGAILSSGTHLLEVIDGVLAASKLEAGREQVALEPLDLHATLGSVEQMFAGLAHDRGVELRFERGPSVPRAIRGDAAKIRQVLINLVGNALKLTDHGQVVVRAAAQPLTNGAERITVAVSDTGPGIPFADQPRIFEAFEQSDSGMRAGGSGLGLTISRSFARLMQGDVTLESVPGEGSTFTFSFVAEPLASDEAPAPRYDSVRPIASSAAPAADVIAALLATLPAPLARELRDAAIRARTRRLEQLAEELAQLSPAAAAAVGALVRDFRYEELIAALDAAPAPD